MTKRNLIIIHRGREYEQDFKEIAQKACALDKNITIYALSTLSSAQPSPSV
jgi:hypothetical protein